MAEDGSAGAKIEECTIPPVQLSAHGFANEEEARATLHKIHSILSVISTRIDLSNLDGVTVSFNYEQSLRDLNRGYTTTHVLTPTQDVAIGVAMSPSVLRDGKLKTHLVLSAPFVISILEELGEETEFFSHALHLLMHECAHVEVTAEFDKCFPDCLLKKHHTNILDNLRWQVILACWDEYAVCRIVGDTDIDPTEDYLETLVQVLVRTRNLCREAIMAYRVHGDVQRVVCEVYGKIGELMKFACYLIGAARGTVLPPDQFEALNEAAEFEWFKPYYLELYALMEALFEHYGAWASQEPFEKIGDLLEMMAEDIGITAKRLTEEETYFDIPLRLESTPLG